MTYPVWQSRRLFPAIANTFSVSGMFAYVKLRNEVAKFSQTFFKNRSLQELPRNFCDVNIFAAAGWSFCELIAAMQEKGRKLLDGSCKNCQFLAERISIIFFGLGTFYKEKPAFSGIGGYLDLLADVLTLRIPLQSIQAADIEPKSKATVKYWTRNESDEAFVEKQPLYLNNIGKYRTVNRLHSLNYRLKYGKVAFSIILKLAKLAASRKGSRLASSRVDKVITAANLVYAVVDVSARVFSAYTEHYKTKA